MTRLYEYTVNGEVVSRDEYESRMANHITREEHDGWQILDETSRSGKQLFRCRTCGRTSQTPDKYCSRLVTNDVFSIRYIGETNDE